MMETIYCPECGHKQTKNIDRKRGNSSFSWIYDFVCDKCHKIIVIEDWGYDYSEDEE